MTAKKSTSKKTRARKGAGKSEKPRASGAVATKRARAGSGKAVVREKASALYGRYFLEANAHGYDLHTDLGVARAIDRGVATRAVDDALKYGVVEPAVMYELVVPRRTLTHRKATDQRLTAEESDRLARVLRVYARSEEALGDAERAHRWIRKPNRALMGRTPLELLSSEAGARAVEKVLGRLEHGVFS